MHTPVFLDLLVTRGAPLDRNHFLLPRPELVVDHAPQNDPHREGNLYCDGPGNNVTNCRQARTTTVLKQISILREGDGDFVGSV